jgi:hypothetical protein
MMKSCFLFGHSDCPYAILPELERRIEKAITNNVTHFYVGNRGNFDHLAAAAVKHLKACYPAIRLYLLLAYHPAERPTEPSDGFDGTYYPLLEKVPRRYAIVRANEAMLRQSDAVICYVNHPGNTRKLLSLAQKRREKGELTLDNVAQMD